MVDCQGTVLETRQDNQGILNIKDDAFATTFYSFIVGWRSEENARLPVLMSGMIGSRQGWIEAPYVSPPVSPAELQELDDIVDQVLQWHMAKGGVA